MYRINWFSIMEGYNDRHNTAFNDLGVWLSTYYRKTKSINTMGRHLGVDPSDLNAKMRTLDIPIQGRGGDYNSRSFKRKKFLKIPAARMARMTIADISAKTGICRGYVSNLTRQHNRQFKRRRALKNDNKNTP